MADLSTIKPVERTVEIHHPADETRLLGIRVSLVSINDPKMKKIKRKIQDEKLRLEARNKHFKADDLEENVNTLLFNSLTGWEWYNPTGKQGDKGFDPSAEPEFKGKKNPEFNQATVMMMLNEPGMEWFGDQILQEISEEKSFFA